MRDSGDRSRRRNLPPYKRISERNSNDCLGGNIYDRSKGGGAGGEAGASPGPVATFCLALGLEESTVKLCSH